MAKKQYSNDKYAYLYKLSHQNLLELLLSAPVPATTPEDEAYVDALEEVILAKENESSTGLLPDVDEQWLNFQKYYRTDNEVDDLSPHQDMLSNCVENKPTTVSIVRKRCLRRTLVIAAVIVVLMALTIPVALGYTSIFNMIGQWTDDYFHFVPMYEEAVTSNVTFPISTQPNTEFDTPQDVLDAYGITQRIVPTWLPSGFSLSASEVVALESAGQNEFSFLYSNADLIIILSFTQHTNNLITSSEYQKDAGSVEEYQVDDIVYYLYTNVNQSCASWCIGNMECSINGDIPMDTLKEMINSI